MFFVCSDATKAPSTTTDSLSSPGKILRKRFKPGPTRATQTSRRAMDDPKVAAQPEPESLMAATKNKDDKDKDKDKDVSLENLRQDKLLAWINRHAIEPQGKRTMKKGKFLSLSIYLYSFPLTKIFTDIILAILEAPEEEQPSKEDIEGIIGAVSKFYYISFTYG